MAGYLTLKEWARVAGFCTLAWKLDLDLVDLDTHDLDEGQGAGSVTMLRFQSLLAVHTLLTFNFERNNLPEIRTSSCLLYHTTSIAPVVSNSGNCEIKFLGN